MSELTRLVGKRVRIHFQPDNPNNRTIHIVAEVEGMLVVRSWSRGRWVYAIHGPEYFELLAYHGNLSVAGAAKALPQ